MNLRGKELRSPSSFKEPQPEYIPSHKDCNHIMSLKSTFRRSLSMIAEMRCICRSFSTQGVSLRAEARSHTSKSIAKHNLRGQMLNSSDYSPSAALLSKLEDPNASTMPPTLKPLKDRHRLVQNYASLEEGPRRGTKKDRSEMLSALDKSRRIKELEKFKMRRWKAGDVYAPHDLGPEEMMKWKQRSRPTKDVFDIMAVNPLDEYRVSTASPTSIARNSG